jgi:hypothetical protein
MDGCTEFLLFLVQTTSSFGCQTKETNGTGAFSDFPQNTVYLVQLHIYTETTVRPSRLTGYALDRAYGAPSAKIRW